jgi:D-alanyl-D-alanine carboxypeptidase
MAAQARHVAAAAVTDNGPTAAGASVVLLDARSGQVLTSAGADIPRYPASLTKLMTLDLAFEAIREGRLSLDTELPVSAHAASVEPVKLGLAAGDEIPVRDAILAMTTMSANDAATALGEYLGGGSEARCAELMTQRAQALGMGQTQFENASGLPNPGQITTARDLAILARDIVVNFPEDQQFFEVQSFNFRGQTVFSNNAMLKTYPGATGMKTGYTVLARHNLIVSAQRDGRVLIGVEMHEASWGDTYTQMAGLLDSGFAGHVAVPEQVQVAAASAPVTPEAAMPPPPALRPAGHASLKTASHALHGLGNWVAELGLYPRQQTARDKALQVRAMRGTGIARVARLEHSGHTLWSAQLAGLTFTSAHQTCALLAAHGDRCHVSGPDATGVAMLTAPSGT